MRINLSQAQVKKTTRIVKIIGDSSNLLILFELTNFGEKSFNELKRMTEINSVTLSKKLTELKKEGLIDSKTNGIKNNYFVTDKSHALYPLIMEFDKIIKGDSI